MKQRILFLLELRSIHDLAVNEVSNLIRGLEQNTHIHLGEVQIVDKILHAGSLSAHEQRRVLENAKSSYFSLVQTVRRELNKGYDYERYLVLSRIVKYLLAVYIINEQICDETVMKLFVEQIEKSQILKI